MQAVRSCLVLTGASALAACASRAPAPSAGPVTGEKSVPAAVSAAPAANRVASGATPAGQKDKAVIPPAGYQVVVSNGKRLYCKTEAVTGSRTEKDKTCLTESELQDMQNNSQQYIQGIQRQGGSVLNPSDQSRGPY